MLRVVKRGGGTYNPPSSVALFVKTNVSLAKFFARLRREECVFHNL